jgi:hypothetical protein
VDVTGDQILETFGFATDKYWSDVGYLCVLCTAFLGATFLLLKYKGRP